MTLTVKPFQVGQKSVRKRAFIAIFCASLLLGAQTLNAQTPSILGSTIPIEKIEDLQHQPLALLAKFPEAGVAMAKYVAKVISNQPSLVDSILSVINDTSPEQASAIGAGMVRAARSLETKQPQNARTLVDKVSRSNNLWLRTTFDALGPHYRPGSLPPLMVMLNPQDVYSSVNYGAQLPQSKSRIGPEKNEDNLPYGEEVGSDEALGTTNDSNLSPRHGTIVAVLISDASHNGAVSTSPTH